MINENSGTNDSQITLQSIEQHLVRQDEEMRWRQRLNAFDPLAYFGGSIVVVAVTLQITALGQYQVGHPLYPFLLGIGLAVMAGVLIRKAWVWLHRPLLDQH